MDQTLINNRILKIAGYISFFALPLFGIFLLQYAVEGSIVHSLSIFTHHPVPFIYTLIFIYAAYGLLWTSTNRMHVTAFVFSVIFILFALVSGAKREILSMPLLPWDFAMGSGIAGLISFDQILHMKIFSNFLLLFIIGLFVAISGLLFICLRDLRIEKKPRILCLIGCLLLFMGAIEAAPTAKVEQSPSACYSNNGFLMGFVMNAKMMRTLNDDTPAYAEQIKKGLENFPAIPATTDKKPNVIFVMSEAFWDPTLLPSIKFSEDPIPNFRALSKAYTSGMMVSPTYGGVTSNIEFEVMTGLSLKYLPYQVNAYVTNIKKPLPALPTYFKKLGYQSIGVHPYDKTFFNREKIYPMLGFDKYVTRDDMPDAVYKGAYISDHSFAKQIITEYEKAQKPIFMYNISMQNHWDYLKENYYPNYDVSINVWNKLDELEQIALKNYTQGIHDADKSLKMLTDYFQNVKEPTAIIFFGDHLPAITEQLSVYKKLGFSNAQISDSELYKGKKMADEQSLVQSKNLFMTPFVIWTNYETPHTSGDVMSANYFGAYVLSSLGLEIPPFYNFLLDYKKKLPVNRHYLSVDAQGKATAKTPNEYLRDDALYQIIQKDVLFNNQEFSSTFLPK
ncbi:MAG: LTA synthase family protein [Hyphomonadaceae bacterium]|nr:LTA synthase family protein [Clostridia bacterium]